MLRTCTFENIFILFLPLIDSLAGYKSLARKVSPENFEGIPLLCSSYTVAVEKCNSASTGPLSMVCYFFSYLWDVLLISSVLYLTYLGWGC